MSKHKTQCCPAPQVWCLTSGGVWIPGRVTTSGGGGFPTMEGRREGSSYRKIMTTPSTQTLRASSWVHEGVTSPPTFVSSQPVHITKVCFFKMGMFYHRQLWLSAFVWCVPVEGPATGRCGGHAQVSRQAKHYAHKGINALMSCDKAFQDPCHSETRKQKYVQQHIGICTHGVKTGLG